MGGGTTRGRRKGGEGSDGGEGSVGVGSDEASDTTVGWDFGLEILFTGAVLDFHLTLFGSSFLGRDLGGSEVVVSSVRSLLNTVQRRQCIRSNLR